MARPKTLTLEKLRKSGAERQKAYRDKLRENSDIKTIRINISVEAKAVLDKFKNDRSMTYSQVIEDLLLNSHKDSCLDELKKSAKWGIE